MHVCHAIVTAAKKNETKGSIRRIGLYGQYAQNWRSATR
jgi:hypothetical protein